jgi:hypothetical protein
MAKPQKTDAPQPSRVLTQLAVDGIVYQPDDLVQFNPDMTAAYADAGYIDPHPEAVEYCRQLGNPLIVHAAPQSLSPDAE